MKQYLWWLPPILYMGLIYFLSSQQLAAPGFVGSDKLLHAIEYAGLAFLLGPALTAQGARPRVAALGAAFIASIYGVTDEWHQSFVPNRFSDVRDAAADAVGAALGAGLYSLTLRVKKARGSISS